jgi:hypothetical protein
LLLEEVGYPLGVRRFEKDLRQVLCLRVACGSDPLDRSIQVIVAAPKRDTIGSQQEPEGSHRLPLIRHPHAASIDNPPGADAPIELGVGVPATLGRHLGDLGPVQFILQLHCSRSGEIGALTLCFVALPLNFIK